MALDIDTEQFKSMTQKQQMAILYENVVEMKSMLSAFKFRVKWLYAWVSTLSAGSLAFAWWTLDKLAK